MSMSLNFVRYFGSSKCVLSAAVAVEKSALAKLRKSTGYSFSKCKEALVKHENDLKQAEDWLKSQAKVLGWEKATKLRGRTTLQGLVSVLFNKSNAIMLEMNCETDFVSRNKKFQGLIQRITQGIFHEYNNTDQRSETNTMISKISLNFDDIANIILKDSQPIKDEIAIGIGELGENLKLRRSISLQTDDSVILAGYTHPVVEVSQNSKDTVQFGKYGAIITFRCKDSSLSPSDSLEFGRQLCQHIIGMNPKEIGSLDDLPRQKKEKMSMFEIEMEREKQESNNDEVLKESQSSTTTTETQQSQDNTLKFEDESDETVLINQDFLLDPDITVRDFLVQNSLEILDFVRYECGESLGETLE